MLNNISKEQLAQVKAYFEKLSPYCNAVYFGGSWVDPVIKNPHDFDYICFVKPFWYYEFVITLQSFNMPIDSDPRFKEGGLLDLSQVRTDPYDQIDWFSYFDILMIKIVGEDVCPKTDVIVKHREAFRQDLVQKAEDLKQNIIKNQKRWYHILRGIYILMNNSYDVNEEQSYEINTLHDMSDGWEAVRDKTIKLLENLK